MSQASSPGSLDSHSNSDPPSYITGELIGNRYCVLRVRKEGSNFQVLDAIDTEAMNPSKQILLKVIRRRMTSERVLLRDVNWLKEYTSDTRMQRLRVVTKVTPDVALVFERNGRTLADIMKDRTVIPFSKRQIQEITLQIISGLEYLHGTNVTHAHLSLDAIWMTGGFGTEMHYHRGRDGFTSMKTLQSTKLQIGYYGRVGDEHPKTSLLGEDQYRAPEVLMGRRSVVQNDQFALGCILFELCLRRPLFVPCFAEGSDYVKEKLMMMIRAFGPLRANAIECLTSRGTTTQGVFNEDNQVIIPTATTEATRRYLQMDQMLETHIRDKDVLHVIRRFTDMDYRKRPTLSFAAANYTFLCHKVY